MTLTIDLPESKIASLKAKAAAQGLSLEDWFLQLAADDAPVDEGRRIRARKAAARMREFQQNVKPDPEGWTVRDYIDFGRP